MAGWGEKATEKTRKPKISLIETMKRELFVDDIILPEHVPTCAMIYGEDGTGKTGLALASITEEDIKDKKQTIVVDLDSGNLPLLLEHHRDKIGAGIIKYKDPVQWAQDADGNPYLDNRLVMASVPVFELVGISSRCQSHELVSEAYAKYRPVVAECFLNVLNCRSAHLGIARTVGQKQSVVILTAEIVVPWYPYYCSVAPEKVPDNVKFYTAVDKHDPVTARPVDLHFPGAYTCNKIGLIGIMKLSLGPFGFYLTQHCPFFPQPLGKSPCVYSKDTRNTVAGQPFVKTFICIPVTVVKGIVGYYQSRNMYRGGFIEGK